MKIIRITKVVNGDKYVYYRYDGKEYITLKDLLRDNFRDQGEFYEKVLGVDRELARVAKWHPYDSDFSTLCDGWDKFIKDKGQIRETVSYEEVDIMSEILNLNK